MSNTQKILAADLTVDDAERLRDFYSAVVGWTVENVSMGDYDDYALATAETGEAVAGVCHARGSNADLPPQWILYVPVENLEASLAKCTELGGSVLKQTPQYALIRDPAGAVMSLVPAS